MQSRQQCSTWFVWIMRTYVFSDTLLFGIEWAFYVTSTRYFHLDICIAMVCNLPFITRCTVHHFIWHWIRTQRETTTTTQKKNNNCITRANQWKKWNISLNCNDRRYVLNFDCVNLSNVNLIQCNTGAQQWQTRLVILFRYEVGMSKGDWWKRYEYMRWVCVTGYFFSSPLLLMYWHISD